MAKINEWMSVSDLMTGLMIIFMFITIVYLEKVKETQTVLVDFVETRQQLHDDLKEKFKQEIDKGELTLGGDLSMKFNNASTLFRSGDWRLTDEFKEKLSDFLPKYLSILLNSEFSEEIIEIRIEGHTDQKPYQSLDKDPYIANTILSQRRALEVLKYMRSMPEYQQFSNKEQEKLEFWFTANGFSYGKSLDSKGEYTYHSNNEINDAMSRRVEFRIITRGDDVLEDFVNQNK